MEYLKDFIEAITASIVQVGANIDTELKSEPLAGLVEATLDPSSLHKNQSATIYVTAVGSGDMTAIETGGFDVTMQMVAYLAIVEPDSFKRVALAQNLTISMLTHIYGQHWGLPYTRPANQVECADLHGLNKGFRPDTPGWRGGVPVLGHAADLYGGDNPNEQLALWAITWEQQLRVDPVSYGPGDDALVSQVDADKLEVEN